MWRLVISIACLRGLSATIAMIVVDLTVTTPANQMADAARARQRGHRLLQCIKTRLARTDISLRRINSVAVGGIGNIACHPTSLIERPEKSRSAAGVCRFRFLNRSKGGFGTYGLGIPRR